MSQEDYDQGYEDGRALERARADERIKEAESRGDTYRNLWLATLKTHRRTSPADCDIPF